MPTQNRRVATYLPPELDDRLKAFITERSLKGESQALITILSEFFNVSYSVARQVDYSTFVTQEQFKEMLDKVSELSIAVESKSPGEMLRKLREKLDLLEKRLDDREADKPRSEHKVEAVPGQMSILDATKSELIENAVSELPDNKEGEFESENASNISSELLGKLKPMTGNALSTRFRLNKDSVAGRKRSQTEDKFLRWTREKDPDGIAWQYNPGDKLYHPLA